MSDSNPYTPPQVPAAPHRPPGRRTLAALVLALLTPIATFLAFGTTCEAVYSRRPPQGWPEPITGILVLTAPALVAIVMVWLTVRIYRSGRTMGKPNNKEP